MKYFIDTEFIEDGKTIDLISIGIVTEDGRDLYLENSEADWSKANEWVEQNVLPHCLSYEPRMNGYFRNSRHSISRVAIAKALVEFCDPEKHGKPEFWGYYSAYDHVVLCQLFGTMMDLPKGWPMYTRDIKQLCDSLGNPKLPEQGKGEHHALADARWNKQAYEFLLKLNA